jgi:hypothetical protein
MAKRCLPGVICIENMTLVIVVILCIIIVALFFSNNSQNQSNHNHTDKIIIKEEHGQCNNPGMFTRPNYGYTNAPHDVLMNPYEPPLKDERYLVNVSQQQQQVMPGMIPINVATNIGAVDASFRQVGILTPLKNSKEEKEGNKILPLLGKPVFTNREKWQYYTMTKHNIKLPIIRNGKDAMNEYGVDIVYNNDVLYVQGYGEPFKATIYENSTIKYLPYL